MTEQVCQIQLSKNMPEGHITLGQTRLSRKARSIACMSQDYIQLLELSPQSLTVDSGGLWWHRIMWQGDSASLGSQEAEQSTARLGGRKGKMQPRLLPQWPSSSVRPHPPWFCFPVADSDFEWSKLFISAELYRSNHLWKHTKKCALVISSVFLSPVKLIIKIIHHSLLTGRIPVFIWGKKYAFSSDLVVQSIFLTLSYGTTGTKETQD